MRHDFFASYNDYRRQSVIHIYISKYTNGKNLHALSQDSAQNLESFGDKIYSKIIYSRNSVMETIVVRRGKDIEK